MKVFYNSERSGYEEIVSYGPEWWTQYREMDAVYKFAGWTLDLMAHFLDRTVNNQFPALADEKTIRIFEGILNIDYDPESSLDDRRRMVLLYYSGTGKLSKSEIQSLVALHMGCESEVSWEDDALKINIVGQEGPRLLNVKVLSIVRRRMPAHIPYAVSVGESIEQTEYIGVGYVLSSHIILT